MEQRALRAPRDLLGAIGRRHAARTALVEAIQREGATRAALVEAIERQRAAQRASFEAKTGRARAALMYEAAQQWPRCGQRWPMNEEEQRAEALLRDEN